MNIVVSTGIFLFFLFAPILAGAFEITGLKAPESMIYDVETGSYFLSNVNGGPSIEDGNGFISKIDKNGTIVNLKFASKNLNAPKGLAIIEDKIFVTDIDTVRSFDKKTGKLLDEYKFKDPKAYFLNDITVGKDNILYISDTGINTIFTLNPKTGQIDTYFQSSSLNGPNGVVFAPDNSLYVSSWNGGQIFSIKDGNITRLRISRFSNLDGIDFDSDGNLYFADFTAGLVCRVRKNLTVEIILRGLKTPADIKVDRENKKLLIPLFQKNSVLVVDIADAGTIEK